MHAEVRLAPAMSSGGGSLNRGATGATDGEIALESFARIGDTMPNHPASHEVGAL